MERYNCRDISMVANQDNPNKETEANIQFAAPLAETSYNT